MKPLTDLEAAVLGDVQRNQPCTAHFIRTRFRDSPTARFSDSAGSIYPLMKRLQERGLVIAKTRRVGQRHVCYYSCSKKGLKSLRRWVGPPIDQDITQNYDPLRTRMMFLEYLTPAQRLLWLDDAKKLLHEKLQRTEANLRDQTNIGEATSDFL